MRALAAACAVTLVSVGTGWAVDQPEPISPDRAGSGTSAATVGRGAFQLETGLAYARESIAGSPPERRFTVEAAIRAGVTEQLELTIEAEPLVWLRGADDEIGPGNVALGAKYRFLDAREGSWVPALAWLPSAKLPVTDPPIGTGKADFRSLLLASFALPEQVSVDLNAGLAANGQRRPSGYLLQALVAATVSRDFADVWTLFTDVFYSSREDRDSRDSVQLDAGIVWRVARDVALDASGVTSLAGPGPDWAVRAGVSVRFGR